jgi:hypothetical protein
MWRRVPTPLDATLAATVARIRLRHALRALAAGVVAGAITLFTSRALGVPASVAFLTCLATAGGCAAAVFARLRPGRTAGAAAAAFERAEPSLRNLVITAQELLATPGASPEYVRARVIADAGRRAAAIDPPALVPLRRDLAAVAGALVLLAIGAAVPLPARSVDSQITRSPNPQIAQSPDSFTIDIIPPAYTGRPAVHLQDPSAVDALAGSHAVISVAAGVKADIRVNGAAIPATPEGVARTVLQASGYLAIDAGQVHRLLPLSVTPDRAPDVRITAPAKDLRMASSAVSIPIVAEAGDDLSLRSFELRYTVVSGTGEQFSFTEGALPAVVSRGSDRAWRLEAALSPAQMKLEPGDAIIYRAVAADRRAGDAGAASSDTFFVEIAGPGDVALAGVEMPPDKERYALSQAMIVLKIERLQAQERSMGRPVLTEAAQTIAAEQRAVRANFIFLLGGEIEDEHVEAEHSSEIAEGRFANKARQDIVRATVLMGRVEHALTAVSTREALPLAREALKALQSAFGHSRYLLRALPSRARIDPARRGSGDLSSAADWNRALAPPLSDPDAEAARAAVMDVIAVARDLDQPAGGTVAVDRLSRLAERLLAVAPGAPDLQPAARDVLAARDALTAGDIGRARAALQRAARPLVARAHRGRIDGRAEPRDRARLAGAAALLAGEGRRE